MTPGAEARRRPEGAPRVQRASRTPAAPARPELGGQGFAAALEVGGPPASVRVSVVAWLLSSVAGLAVAGILWQEQDAIRTRLAAAAGAQDPSVAADVLADTARYAFLGSLAGVALVAVVNVALALGMRAGRTWTHPVLVLTGVLAAAVAVVVQDLVNDPARDLLSHPVRVVLLGQVVVLLTAVVAMLTPGARRWLRRVRALRR